MLLESPGGQPRDLFQGARPFEQVGGAGHDHQLFLAPQLRVGFLVHLDHRVILPADNQQRRRLDARQGFPGQIRPPPARHDRADLGPRSAAATSAVAAPVLAPK
jgi:hypothetical protein